jgi:hypothetical protein
MGKGNCRVVGERQRSENIREDMRDCFQDVGYSFAMSAGRA